ncbi:MAG TPA: DUF3617 domain-containing protein [Rhizomicrobium sp.]|jgi:hypothetical protein|nr:DUF3617 domain-containing protein [Rhizomicrobium sp.]
MFSRKAVVRAGLAFGTAAVLPIAALAAHGKAGLWEITTHMNMPGAMAAIPPDQMARMQAMGIHMPNGQTVTSQHCMTAEEVAADKPPPIRNSQDCTTANVVHDGRTINVDVVCKGAMDGQGHFTLTYDSDEHYTGNYMFTGSAHGHPASMSNSIEGKWISADCGSVK